MPPRRKGPPNDLFRAARERLRSPADPKAPMSREEFADACNLYLADRPDPDGPVTANHIGKIEQGVNTWPRALRRQAYRALLGAHTDAEIGLFNSRRRPRLSPVATADSSGQTSLELTDQTWDVPSVGALAAFLADKDELEADEVLRLSHEWRVTDPPQVVEMTAGRRVGLRLAKLALERADALRRMDDFLGGGDMHALASREVQVTVDLVRSASYTESTGKLLLAAVGELCQLAGWVASDAGLYARAQRFYLGGVSAAHAAQNQPLAANLLSSLAYQVANVGDPGDAALLALSAYQGARASATATTRALLMERVAWANARLGDAQATVRALGEVDEAWAETEPSVDPAWVYWLNRDEIDVMAGRCHTELKRPAEAIPLLAAAVARYDDRHARELSLYLSWLAEAHVYAGNVDEAARTAARGLTFSAAVTSARGTERVQLVRRLLVQHHGNAAVDEFEEQAAAILGPRDHGGYGRASQGPAEVI